MLVRSTRRLSRARLHYGHGTDSARDDAAALLWHVMRLPLPAPAAVYRRRVPPRVLAALDQLLQRRIRERIPVVYLTQRCWFAGLPMYVDARVLIPRSPIAELIERRFQPWIDPARVRRILDLGTGSGCIAIACARAFARCRVDAADISAAALAVAQINIRRHRLSARVRAVRSDHFAGLGSASYDIIVSNPPYVPESDRETLHPQVRDHEPAAALFAGPDGLDLYRRLIPQAHTALKSNGLLALEIGHGQREALATLQQTWHHVSFVDDLQQIPRVALARKPPSPSQKS